ncbi:MAG TPA: M48 family metallopeptidase [Rhizomicrobium sp.]|jgi:STE24 endopeptidase|nr:M48 family metallopeptidase [Rhizomicrobium sp.]
MAKLWSCAAVLVAALLLALAAPAAAQGGPSAAPTSTIDVHALPPAAAAPAFDAGKATDAYLSRVSGEARAKSDSYFEGGYVLTFVDALYAILVSALLLFLRISSRMRKIAEGMTRSRFLQVPIYIAQYLVLTTVLSLPLSIYEEYFREHAYGLSNQNFMQWSGDFAKGFAISLIAFVILGTLVYSAIRATKQYWWAWGTAIAIVFFILAAVIAPVYISPLFNDYKPLRDGPVKQHILSLARSEGIPVTNVYEFDASRQSKRISANVSGMFGTTRISLNDNLLNRSSEREIMAVLGHEMGHYVLDHSTRLILMMGLVFLAGFGFAAWGFNILARIFGGIWDVRGIDDPAGLPVLAALASFFFLIATPVTNTISRTTEAQADIFGVNASRQPDGFAEATLQLSEYRKLDPSPLEEVVFYDHPSGRSRISMMMRWKAEHLNDPDIKAGPVSPQ